MNTMNQLLARALSPRPTLTDAEHDALLAHDRTGYAGLLAVRAVAAETVMQVVLRLLAVTDGPRDLAREDRLIAARLPAIPVDVVIRGLETLVERRVNNQRTAGLIRSYLLGLPSLEGLAVRRRAALRRLLTHALGRRGVATCLAFLATPLEALRPHQVRYVHKALLRYGPPEIVTDVLRFVFGRLDEVHREASPLAAYLQARYDLKAGEGLPYATLKGIASTYHRGAPKYLVPRLAASQALKRAVGPDAPVDGPVVAAMKRFLAAPDGATWQAALHEVEAEAKAVPHLPLRLAVVLDASASMEGTGHRRHHAGAVAGAVLELARRTAEAVDVIRVGGRAHEVGLPQAEGATNLALALVEATRTSADGILVLSDGYENQHAGDAAGVLEALARLGLAKPLVHVMPAFTEREKLDGRRTLGATPVLLETGERGFDALWLRLLAELRPEALHATLEVMS